MVDEIVSQKLNDKYHELYTRTAVVELSVCLK